MLKVLFLFCVFFTVLPSLYAAEEATPTQFQLWLQKNNAKAAANERPKQTVNTTTTTTTASSGAPGVVVTAPMPSNTQNPRAVNRTQASQVLSPPYHYSYDKSQQAMLNTIPPSAPKPTEDSNLAFQALLQQNMPLVPRQIVELRQQIDLAQRAAATPPTVPPKPVSNTLMIDLAPGTTPPAIRLAQGYVTSLVFVDSTGKAWPIESFDIGNPKMVNLQWDQKGNILLLQSVIPYAYGDVVVRLVGLPTPITLEIISGQRVVDYRVDIHVPGLGPNSANLVPIGSVLPASASQVLLGVLDGVAPPDSKALSITGTDALAWVTNDYMYLRTRFAVLSPAWSGKMVSPDGMIAYQLPKTSTVLISRYGEPTEIKIEGY